MIKGTAKYVLGVYGVYVRKAQECSENRFTAAERERKREPQRRLRRTNHTSKRKTKQMGVIRHVPRRDEPRVWMLQKRLESISQEPSGWRRGCQQPQVWGNQFRARKGGSGV